MGDMADDLINTLENSEVLVKDNRTGKELIVSGVEIMYTNVYIEPYYTILGEINRE